MRPAPLEHPGSDQPADTAKKSGNRPVAVVEDDALHGGFHPQGAGIRRGARNVNKVRAFLSVAKTLIPGRIEISCQHSVPVQDNKEIDVGSFP